MCTNDAGIGLLVIEDKWANMKSIVLMLQAQVLENPEVDLCIHYIMSDRGTFIFGTQTYYPLNPYLKVLHLIIDGCRLDRDFDGWKVSTSRPKLE